MCVESRDQLDNIKLGVMCYISRQEGRNAWDFYTEEFAITPALRAAVTAKLSELDMAWKDYEDFGQLPPRLDPEISFGKLGPAWRCRARSPQEDRGKFCPSKSACMALSPTPLPAQLATIQPEPSHKIVHRSAT